MDSVLLVRYGEIMLKGLNRPMFEKKLTDNIKSAIKSVGECTVTRSQGRVYVIPMGESIDMEALIKKTCQVLGVVSVSPAVRMESDMERIYEVSTMVAEQTVMAENAQTFKVEARRQDKSFPLTSPEVCKKVGARVLEKVKGLRVDVHKPDFTLWVEIREQTYVYARVIPGYGGMPVGTNGKAMLLLSGGIDSPVAGFMMAKRGVCIEGVHFYSYPYTSERSKEKVLMLSRILARYTGRVKLHIVPFTDIQLAIQQHCDPGYMTVVMRRVMMRMAQSIAQKTRALALVTGESVGQVASQTIEALYTTDHAVSLPVFRPLIGMDKNEVIDIAKRIDTYDTSILPYEDCCTVFTPKHPVTRPKIHAVLQQEKKIELDTLEQESLCHIEEHILS